MEVLYKFINNNYSVWEYLDYCPITPVEPVNVVTDAEPVNDDLVDPLPLTIEEVSNKKRETWINKSLELFGEDNYVSNYANPFATISHNRITIIVTKDGDKVAIKIFDYLRVRNKGRKFFKVTTRVDYVSFNIKTNSLYTGYIQNYHKKRKFSKGIRKNEFWSDPINRVINMINTRINGLTKKNLNLNFHKTEIIDNVISTFFKNIPESEKYNNYKPSERLYKLYCDYNGIKTPNNWNLFVPTFPALSLKILRKNDMKLIDSFMDIKNVRGDKIRKILHVTDKIGNLDLYKWCIAFFGYDYVNGKTDEFLTEIVKNDNFYGRFNPNWKFSKTEKNNIYEILKLVVNSGINSATFYDHFVMYNQIKQFEEVKWKSKTYEQFKDEHLQYTERVAFYTTGEYFRKYNQEFKDKLQEPILGEYYPVILETSTQYNMESFVQSNCVKGYIDRPSSIIVSLRRGGVESKERATIDFSVDKLHNKMKVFRHQTLGRFNYPLTPEWENPVQILENRFKDLVNDNVFKLFNCVYKLGYKEYLSNVKYIDAPGWEDKNMEKLVWENKQFGNLTLKNEIIPAQEIENEINF